MARYQRGFLRKKKGRWVYCFTAIRPIDGTRTERGRVVGLVSELSKSGAWTEVERRGLNVLVNETGVGAQPTIGLIAAHYLENHTFSSHGTAYLHNHLVKDYLTPRFGDKVTVEIKSKEILGWLESLTFAVPITVLILPSVEFSRPLSPHPALAEVLKAWQAETPYSKPDDFVFASFKLHGKKPRTVNMIVEDYIRPAAIKASVISVRDGGTYDHAGNQIKRFGFHGFRHTLASFLLAQGNNPVLIKNLLRWSKISMLDVYGHVMTDEKIAAQGSMLERIMPKTNAVQ